MIVCVDSSVWIALLRGQDTPEVARLRAIEPPHAIVIGDLILLEVLQGASDEAHAARIERNLREFSDRAGAGPGARGAGGGAVSAAAGARDHGPAHD